MARGSSSRTSRPRSLFGEVLWGALLVVVFGGWWLYNGGTDGGINGCVKDAKDILAWLASLGSDQMHELRD